jgi:hypothetical protein
MTSRSTPFNGDEEHDAFLEGLFETRRRDVVQIT